MFGGKQVVVCGYGEVRCRSDNSVAWLIQQLWHYTLEIYLCLVFIISGTYYLPFTYVREPLGSIIPLPWHYLSDCNRFLLIARYWYQLYFQVYWYDKIWHEFQAWYSRHNMFQIIWIDAWIAQIQHGCYQHCMNFTRFMAKLCKMTILLYLKIIVAEYSNHNRWI